MKIIWKITFWCLLTLSSNFDLNCMAQDNLTAECQNSAIALAPLKAATTACVSKSHCLNPSISDPTSDCSLYCRNEIQNMFRVGLVALEKCAQMNSILACNSFSDLTRLCQADDDCARAKNTYDKYCSQKVLPAAAPKSHEQVFVFAENFDPGKKACLHPALSIVLELKNKVNLSSKEMHSAIVEALRDNVCTLTSGADIKTIVGAKLETLLQKDITIEILGYSFVANSKKGASIPLAGILSDGSGYIYGNLTVSGDLGDNLSSNNKILLKIITEGVLLKSNCQEASAKAMQQIKHEIQSSFNKLQSEQTIKGLNLKLGRVCN